jgi:hypothetical protein
MNRLDTTELAHRLGQQAEAVCRHYLSNGRRQGGYWVVGDVRNTPGRSMFVRLFDSAKGPAGKYQDAATGEHGDLLDVIREVCQLADFADTANEARRFLSLPQPDLDPIPRKYRSTSVPSGSAEAARRLFAMSQPITGTLAQAYLESRGITLSYGQGSLRFHPRCYYRPGDYEPAQMWPAMIAAVTDLTGTITGIQRTWLAPDGRDKAPIEHPRKAMGNLLGHGVRFGMAGTVMVAGEGIETMLSLRQVLPDMAMVAALSSAHLAAMHFPQTLSRLYIARDNDPAGEAASAALIERAHADGIEAIVLSPMLGDFNEDLGDFGVAALQAHLRVQLAPQDVARFLEAAA